MYPPPPFSLEESFYCRILCWPAASDEVVSSVSTTKENVANTTVTPPKTAPSADQGLADLSTSPTKEAGKKQEVLQKAQLEPKSVVKEVKEKTPPSPTTHIHRYALEV